MDLDIIIAKAKDGDAACQMALGMAYSFGDSGLQRNDGLAITWFKEAAEGERSDAMFALCDCYLYGLGVPADLHAAAKWYSRAVERDNVEDPSLIRSPDINVQYVPTSAGLLAILGRAPMTRLEADRCVWRFLGARSALDPNNPRIINAGHDQQLLLFLLGQRTIRIFKLRRFMDSFLDPVPAGSDGAAIIDEAVKPRPFVPFQYGDLKLKPDTTPQEPPGIQQPNPSGDA